MSVSYIIDKSEELVETVESLIKHVFKDKKEYRKNSLDIVEGSVWSYNNNPDYTCEVLTVYEDCLDIKMCARWKGTPYYEVLIKGFFESNFTEVLVFDSYN